MKNSKKTIIRIGLVILCTTVLSYMILIIFDKGLNGMVTDWFYNTFMYQRSGDTPGSYIIQPDTVRLRQFITVSFIFVVVVIVLISWVVTYLYSRNKIKEEITYLSGTMGKFLNSDETFPGLPSEYAEIESQLVQIKAATLRKEQLLQTESQQKNDLITYLAHDLKTPLASVIGYLSLLDESPDMTEKQKAKYTGIALDKAYRLEQLINEFFEITRFNLHSIVLNKSRVKISMMLEQMIDEFYPMLAPQGKKVTMEVEDELYVLSDSDKLARVFNNILKNAIAYSYENSQILISIKQVAEDAIMTFTNQGDPIPKTKLSTIFEKFYRLDTARSSRTGGAGLGLAIAKEIMTAHGGDITVTSNEIETVFTVVMPIKGLQNHTDTR